MPHEARDNGNGKIVFIQQDVRNVLFIVELNPLDSHGSLAPSVEMGHLFFTRTDALQDAKCLLNNTKPGKKEKRPLGIPVKLDRGHQHLCKQALEPEWVAKFEANRYGVRPGRSSQAVI